LPQHKTKTLTVGAAGNVIAGCVVSPAAASSSTSETSKLRPSSSMALPSNCKIPSAVQLPPAAARGEATPAAEGHRHFRAIHPLVGIRSTFAVPHLAQSSEHPNTFTSFRRPTLECSDVRLGWQETRKRVLELRRPVTVPREICSLGRMNDDRADLEVFQQCRDLVFGDWTSPRYSCHCESGSARSSCTTCSDVICVRFLVNIARSAARS
jgi:hypothetical protein